MAIAAVGLALARLVWQPPVLGYLIAGLLIGPYTLPHPVISNLDTIELLAELGLILLLFGIGLELGWRRIREIGLRVLVIGVVEISTLTYLGVLISDKVLGISGANALYLGGAMAISSSAILLKGLRDSGNLRAGWGQTIVGILLVEDFAAVILLTLLAGLATTGSTDLADVGWLAAKLGIFCIAALAFGALLAPRLMRFLSRMQSDETLLVASLGCCFGLALGAEFLGLSAAAGAFLIGVVIGDTDAAGRVTRLVNPVRDMFGALFFLSIGMLIDYRTLDDYIVPALVVVGVFMGGKIMANTIGAVLAGRRSRTAAQVGMTMPQMGEFSLAIGHLSATNAAVGPVVAPVLAIATAITAVFAPLTSKIATPTYDWLERRAPPATCSSSPPTSARPLVAASARPPCRSHHDSTGAADFAHGSARIPSRAIASATWSGPNVSVSASTVIRPSMTWKLTPWTPSRPDSSRRIRDASSVQSRPSTRKSLCSRIVRPSPRGSRPRSLHHTRRPRC